MKQQSRLYGDYSHRKGSVGSDEEGEDKGQNDMFNTQSFPHREVRGQTNLDYQVAYNESELKQKEPAGGYFKKVDCAKE